MEPEFGLSDPCGSLQTWDFLWFCDSVEEITTEDKPSCFGDQTEEDGRRE